MLVREDKWARVRDEFTEEEKGVLQEAITGHSICPRGTNVDEAKLPVELRLKLRSAVMTANERRLRL